MPQDHQSGKFEDGSVLPKEKFQESMIFKRGLWLGVQVEGSQA